MKSSRSEDGFSNPSGCEASAAFESGLSGVLEDETFGVEDLFLSEGL
ncbi:MAG: hypothetical protein K6A43_08405 [Treponema sp.]|nr:hypothetical protein [Treponema sp.]